jgi:DNA-binding beta-propeller fold protein YncE
MKTILRLARSLKTPGSRFALVLLIACGAFTSLEPGVFRPREFRVYAQQPDLLYVCVQDDAKVAVIDMASRKVLRTIDFQALGFPATAKPHYIVVEPDGSYWYVSLIGANRVLKMDRQDKIAGQYEMETPGMLALAGAKQLVATRSMSAVNPPKRIAIIDRAAMMGEEVEVLFARPHPMAATSTYAYTGSLGVNQIATISLADQKVNVAAVPNPDGGGIHSLVQFTVSKDGKRMLATGDVSGQLLLFNLETPAAPKAIGMLQVGKMAFDPVFSPDEKTIWVPVKSTNEVVVVDVAKWSEVARIKDASLQQPQQIAFSSDGARAFVTNNNKMDHMADPAMAGHTMPGMDGTASLVVINAKTHTVEQAIPLGKNLTGMGKAQK